MKNYSEFTRTQHINIARYVSDCEYFYRSYKELKSEPYGSAFNLEVPETFVDDAVKGLLLYNEKLTGISEDALKSIQGASAIAHYFDKNEDAAVMALDSVLALFEEGEQDKDALFRFLETCKIMTLSFEVGSVVSGDGLNVPIYSVCKMVHPEAWRKVEKDAKPDHLAENENTYSFAWDLIRDGETGEHIYNSLYNLLDETYM